MNTPVYVCVMCEADAGEWFPTEQGRGGPCIQCGKLTIWSMPFDLAVKELPFKWLVSVVVNQQAQG